MAALGSADQRPADCSTWRGGSPPRRPTRCGSCETGCASEAGARRRREGPAAMGHRQCTWQHRGHADDARHGDARSRWPRWPPRGAAFDRLFLERMIAHHEGAIDHGRGAARAAGSAYDPVLLRIHQRREQRAARRDRADERAAAQPSGDPRADLKAGFRDAGQAISNLAWSRRCRSRPGFFDPANPADLPPLKAARASSRAATPRRGDAKTDGADFASGRRYSASPIPTWPFAATPDRRQLSRLQPLPARRTGMPTLISSVVCPGGQGDVSIVGDMLIMSVEQSRGRNDCGLQGVSEDVSAERFRGLRIFDISDTARPVQVGQVQTCRGSHTHSVVRARARRPHHRLCFGHRVGAQERGAGGLRRRCPGR